jgi:beta-glucosidase
MTGEAASRSNINLLENQQALLKALKATGKTNCSGNNEWPSAGAGMGIKNCAVYPEAWYPGTMAGQAISEVLYGEAAPRKAEH